MEQTGVAAKLQPDEELSGLWKDLAIKGFAGPNATWTQSSAWSSMLVILGKLETKSCCSSRGIEIFISKIHNQSFLVGQCKS